MFFVAAKVLWFAFQPSSVLAVCLAAGLLSVSSGRVEAGKSWLIAAVSLVVIAVSPIPQLMTLVLEQRFERADLDAGPVTGILLLGGGEEAPVVSRRHVHAINEAGERLTETVALSRRLPMARIVAVGGSGRLTPQKLAESGAMGQMLLSLGVDATRLEVEGKSRDTWENAQFARDLVQPKAGERWLLVTSAWHMPRAMGAFRKTGFAVEPWPVDYRTVGWEGIYVAYSSFSEGLARLDVTSREYVGLLVSWLNGRSSALFPAPCVGARTCG